MKRGLLAPNEKPNTTMNIKVVEQLAFIEVTNRSVGQVLTHMSRDHSKVVQYQELASAYITDMKAGNLECAAQAPDSSKIRIVSFPQQLVWSKTDSQHSLLLTQPEEVRVLCIWSVS